MELIQRLLSAILALFMAIGGFFTDIPMRIPLLSSHAAVFARRRGDTKLYIKKEASMFISVGSFFGDSTVTFPHVYAPRNGVYTLNIYYFTAEDRSFMLSVNENTAQQVPCKGAGDTQKRMVKSVSVSLRGGWNSLKFSCFRGAAPDLDKITVTRGGMDEAPPASALPPDNEVFDQGGLTLTLDKANGVYSIHDGANEIVSAACAAALIDGHRVYAQDYSTHTVAAAELSDGFGTGLEILFTHRGDGLWTMRQSFKIYEGKPCALSSVELFDEEAGGEIATNWIAPLIAAGDGCLRGGDSFIRVPFDNDDYATFDPVSVNSVGESYEMTALVNSKTGSAVVVGSVTHDSWKTGIHWQGYGGSVRRFDVVSGFVSFKTRDTQPHGTLRGEALRSSTIYIGVAGDWRGGLDAYGEANAVIAPPLPWNKPMPIGYNSWGTLQADVSTAAMYAISDYVKENFHDSWKTPDTEVYINWDSFWNNRDSINSAEKAVAYVDYVKANGQKAGIYYTPFAIWLQPHQLEGRTLNDEHGNIYPLEECLLHDAQGSLLPLWDGALAYDVTHPAVKWRIYWDIKYFLDCGFEYIKFDFTGHGAMEGAHHDSGVQTGIQAYNEAMGAIAAQIGDRMFINMAMSPIFPHQYVHSRRIACDTFYSLKDTKYMLNSLSFCFWQQKLFAYPDPDHTLVWGREGKAGENEARSRVTSSVISGTTLLMGDNFPDPAGSAAQARDRFEKLLCNPDILAVARVGKIFRPASFTTPYRQGADNVYVMEDGGRVYIAVFNLESWLPKKVTLDLEALTGKTAKSYVMKELWSGETLTSPGTKAVVSLEKADAKLFQVELFDDVL
ncbi:MAG: hypothetical protein FWH26_00620 [Oscillospiraceae bacterium]|nr:hypothetical protein [Oscillospiraceae bacterium]